MDHWARMNPKGNAEAGPPCERCGSNKSERYRTPSGEVKCVNDRGCVLRRRAAG
jgi:hypothetical protein